MNLDWSYLWLGFCPLLMFFVLMTVDRWRPVRRLYRRVRG